MYPTVVMVLIETHRSMTDVCGISPSIASKLAGAVASEARPATSRHFTFAVGPVHSTVDNEISALTRVVEPRWAGTLGGHSRSKRESG